MARLQHEQHDEKELQERQAEQTSRWFASAVASEQRYDQETVQRVISVASMLQARHQETLSAEQIEAIGAEVGLDPRFVRRALAQVHAELEKAERTTAETSSGLTLRPVWNRRRATVAVSVPVLFTLMTAIVLSVPHDMNDFNIVADWVAFGVAPAVLLGMGYALRGKRASAMAGVALVGGTLSTILVGSIPHGGGGGPASAMLEIYAMLGAGGAAIATVGAVGGALRDRFGRRSSGRPESRGTSTPTADLA